MEMRFWASGGEGGPRLAARFVAVAAVALFAVVLVPAAFGASTYTVTPNAPAGPCTETACSLSDAITAANSDPGSTIRFSTAMTITLAGNLPDVTAR